MTNLRQRYQEWRDRPLVSRALPSDLLVVGPPRYRITQPGKPFKAKRTWERAVQVYLASRKVA